MLGKKLEMGFTDLMFAASLGQTDKVKEIISIKSKDINAQNCTGWTALMFATSAGHLNIVKTLINKGADPKIREKYGRDAAGLSLWKKNTQLINYLSKLS